MGWKLVVDVLVKHSRRNTGEEFRFFHGDLFLIGQNARLQKNFRNRRLEIFNTEFKAGRMR